MFKSDRPPLANDQPPNPLVSELTARDYFACEAMTGIAFSAAFPHSLTHPIGNEEAARYAYGIADAMLKERAK